MFIYHQNFCGVIHTPIFFVAFLCSIAHPGWSGENTERDEKGRTPSEIERELKDQIQRKEKERAIEVENARRFVAAFLIPGDTAECVAYDRLASTCILPLGTFNAILLGGVPTQKTQDFSGPEPALVKQTRWIAVRPSLERAWLREIAWEQLQDAGISLDNGKALAGAPPALLRRIAALDSLYGVEIDRRQDQRNFQIYSSTDSLFISSLYDTLRAGPPSDRSGILYGMAPSAFHRIDLPEDWVRRSDSLPQGRWCRPFRSDFAFHTLRYIGDARQRRAPLAMRQWILRRLAELTAQNMRPLVGTDRQPGTRTKLSTVQDTFPCRIRLAPERSHRLGKHVQVLQDSMAYAQTLDRVSKAGRLVSFQAVPGPVRETLKEAENQSPCADTSWNPRTLPFGVWSFRPIESRNSQVGSTPSSSGQTARQASRDPYPDMIADLQNDYVEKSESLLLGKIQQAKTSIAADTAVAPESPGRRRPDAAIRHLQGTPFEDWVGQRILLHPDITPDPS